MTDEPRDGAGGNVLQFQTAEERLRTRCDKNQNELLALLEQVIACDSKEEAMKMEFIWLSKGRQAADKFVELRESADRLRAKSVETETSAE